MSAFHWQHGIYFRRLDDGSVETRIRLTAKEVNLAVWTGGEAYRVEIIPPNEWASIVAHVTTRGDTADAYADALALHGAAPTPETPE